LAGPKNRATSARARLGDHSTREITAPGDLPQRPSKDAHPFGRSAALAGAAVVGPGCSVQSRIPMRSHRRSARSRFYWRRRSTDHGAIQSDKQAVRRRSRIQVRVYRHLLDAGGVRNVIGNPLLRLLPTCQFQPFGAPVRAARARANRSARSGCARQYESIASRGVGGIKGRLRARVSTGAGKISGRFLERRERDRLFRSACSVCQFDMRLRS
jgi:hypothetical protein